ncbi:hypothetical protein OG836_14155 [Micromonospora zamorensis]|uniref:hypothetical protein n=1 Tax=Micromonospora zamorensis TaxID=709883 RepID=UPI002E1D6B1E
MNSATGRDVDLHIGLSGAPIAEDPSTVITTCDFVVTLRRILDAAIPRISRYVFSL